MVITTNIQTIPSATVLVGNSTPHITHTAHADVIEQIHCLLQLLVELLGLFFLSKSKVQESPL